jgi:uncharacterized membrane protein
MTAARDPHESTLEVLRRLVADAARLVRAYRAALRAQVRATGRDLAVAGLLAGLALVLAVLVPVLAVAVLILVLALWLPAWLAVLGVLVLVAGASVGLALLGLRRLRRRRAAWAAQVGGELQWVRGLFHREL